MRTIHHIWLNIYAKPEDDPSLLEEKLRALVPFNLEKNKLKINKSNLSSEKSSFKERVITILEIHLEKTAHINKFLKHLNEILNKDQKELLLRQKESRLDITNHFFIRFDKNKLQNNEYFITDSGDCFHVRFSVAAYPATRSNALKIIDNLFKE